MVSHPENGSDSPIGSDRDRGRDKLRIGFLNTPEVIHSIFLPIQHETLEHLTTSGSFLDYTVFFQQDSK